MDLSYSSEQVMLRDSARRFLAENYPFDRRQAIAAGEGFDRALWSRFAELGWLGLPFAEENGGFGGGAVEIGILMEAFGRALVIEPWLPAVVLAGGLVERLGTAAQRESILLPLIAGDAIPAFAHQEREAGAHLAHVATRALRHGSSFRIEGRKTLVLGGPFADTFLVSARLSGRPTDPEGLSLFIVPANAPGLRVTPYRLVDGSRAADLEVDGVVIDEDARLGGGDVHDAIEAAFDRATAALASEAVGAMDALLDATVAHAKQRVQFGKPLATFQALQHRMAEMAVKCQEARASALLATLSADAPRLTRVRGVSGAKAKIGRISRHVAQEAIQLHGAMGFSEELAVGSWFKRLFAIENLLGSTAHHLKRYGEAIRHPDLAGRGLLREPTAGRMGATGLNLELTPDEVAFRDEIRAFLDEALTEDLRRAERLNPSFLAHPPIGLAWQAKLREKGWVAPSWPEAHGGTGWTLAQRYIFDQECERAGEPHFRGASLKMIGPVLMRYGTEEQKAHYLPRILSGEDFWAQGYSEPGSGSDLASLSTKAVRDGDHYVINGTKIWTTLGHFANRMFALVRTADTGRKQEGITFLLIDMTAPGITVKPIISICGTHEFNQVFFDDVRVPVANRVGEEGEGWEIAKYLLEFERGGAFAGGLLRALLERLRRIASEPGSDGQVPMEDPLVAARFAEIGTDIDANDMLELDAMSQVQAGQNPGAVPSSTMKIERSRIRQSLAELTASILGPDSLRWEPHRPLHEMPPEPSIAEERKVAAAAYFNSRSQSIFGGSNEIQLEIIAKVLLR